jgi:hypothetical protein
MVHRIVPGRLLSQMASGITPPNPSSPWRRRAVALTVGTALVTSGAAVVGATAAQAAVVTPAASACAKAGGTAVVSADVWITTCTFSTAGSYLWTAPTQPGAATLTVYGAQGTSIDGGTAGKGGEIQGTPSVPPGQQLQIYVGSSDGNSSAPNGFGRGGTTYANLIEGTAANGGAASSVFASGTLLLVAGGGGGTGQVGVIDPRDSEYHSPELYPYGANGGDGGLQGTSGSSGGNFVYDECGSLDLQHCQIDGGGGGGGASSTAPGAGGGGGNTGSPGGSGFGGEGGGYASAGGGGGGGYFGGGGGGVGSLLPDDDGGYNGGGGGGGGGGSSYAAPSVGSVSASTGVQSGDGMVVITMTNPTTLCEGSYYSAGNFVWHAGFVVGNGSGYCNNAYTLAMQNDDNLVLYNRLDKAVWATGTSGKAPQFAGYATMQGDGNFVVYGAPNNTGPLWATGTNGKAAGGFFQFQTDGNLCVYTASSVAVWCSGSNGR